MALEALQGQLAVAAHLRQRLADFEHLKPRGTVSGSTRELLTHWRSPLKQGLKGGFSGSEHVSGLARQSELPGGLVLCPAFLLFSF